MKDSIFHYRIDAQRKSECARWVCNTPGSLQQRSSESVRLSKLPKCRSFLRSSPLPLMNKHMKFSQDIMRQYRRHQVEMISVKPSDGNVIHIALRLQFSDYVFLGTSAVMKVEDLLHSGLLVCHDHLELDSVLLRNKEVKLNNFLGLLFYLLTDKEKTKLLTGKSIANLK